MQNPGMTRTFNAPFDEVLERITVALSQEGFGILTEIDVDATLKKKLGVEFGPYRILGACNPLLAHRALTADPRIGLMLPCNVVVRAVPDGTEVAVFDPMTFAGESAPAAIRELAVEAAGRLDRALTAA